MQIIYAYANEQDIPQEMRIWERRSYVCYEGPVNWELMPTMTLSFFAREDEAFEVCKNLFGYDKYFKNF